MKRCAATKFLLYATTVLLSMASALDGQTPPGPRDKEFARVPLIAEFKRIGEACPTPDADRQILSFTVTNRVTRVVVSAIFHDRSWTPRIIYDHSAPSGTSWPSMSEEVRDPDPNRGGNAGAIEQYKIEVTGASGQKTSSFLGFSYSTPVSFEILSSQVTQTRLAFGRYEYRVRYRGENIRSIVVTVNVSDPTAVDPVRTFDPVIVGEYITFSSDDGYFAYAGTSRFTYTASGFRNACKVEREEIVREVPLLGGVPGETPAAKPDPKPEPKPPPKPEPEPRPAPGKELPDLVPVIDSYDGYSVTFHIENRGPVAVTRPFVVFIDPLFGRSSFSIDIADGIEPRSSSSSITRDVGFGSKPADSVAVNVDSLGQVRESDERNNTATARTKRR